MFGDGDIDDAVAAGALSPEAAASFRAFLVAGRATPMVDEEQFRLVSGFNDIFVTIAAALLLGALAWLGGSVAGWAGAAAVMAASWGLGEYFTRRRRLALPSILLLLGVVGGAYAALALLLDPVGRLGTPIAAAGAAGIAWLHWRRFKVPITIAAGTAALVGLLVSLIVAAWPAAAVMLTPLLLIAGLVVFAFAMHWDMSDPGRLTRRSDVAFWLHLLAAPLIVHPIFKILGLLDGRATAAHATLVLIVYLVMALVALAVDRRALLVSALGYVLYAITVLFRAFGGVGMNFALTALIIGSALLTLSALWRPARLMVLARVPADIRRRLPG